MRGPVAKKPVKPRRASKRRLWSDYEDVSQYVLEQLRGRLGLAAVEPKQTLTGLDSGTDWEVDAKCIRDGDAAILIVECRRYKSRLTQEALAAIAYRIRDTRSAGGFTISPMKLQKGAKKVADANSVRHIQLHPDSTPAAWFALIDDVFHVGFVDEVKVGASDTMELTVRGPDRQVIERRTYP